MKLQPLFSYQAYQPKGDEKADREGEKKQLYYFMSNEHIQVANAVNATIDDESFFLHERQTSYVWVNNTTVFTQTYAIDDWTSGGTIDTIPLGITGGATGNFTVIYMMASISNGTLSSSNTIFLPNVDVTTADNEISIVRNGTNIVITSGGTDYSSYSGYVTIYYIKS